MTPPQTTRVLLDTDTLQVGEFRCVPAHPLWNEVNDNIGIRPHVVFPRATVYIERRGCNPVLATPNHVVFYGSHERYRRQLHDPRGARATFVAVEPGLWEELVGRAAARLAGRERPRRLPRPAPDRAPPSRGGPA